MSQKGSGQKKTTPPPCLSSFSNCTTLGEVQAFCVYIFRAVSLHYSATFLLWLPGILPAFALPFPLLENCANWLSFLPVSLFVEVTSGIKFVPRAPRVVPPLRVGSGLRRFLPWLRRRGRDSWRCPKWPEGGVGQSSGHRQPGVLHAPWWVIRLPEAVTRCRLSSWNPLRSVGAWKRQHPGIVLLLNPPKIPPLARDRPTDGETHVQMVRDEGWGRRPPHPGPPPPSAPWGW